jgi:hypothetical protein
VAASEAELAQLEARLAGERAQLVEAEQAARIAADNAAKAKASAAEAAAALGANDNDDDDDDDAPPPPSSTSPPSPTAAPGPAVAVAATADPSIQLSEIDMLTQMAEQQVAAGADELDLPVIDLSRPM